MEEDANQKETSITDTLQSSSEAWGPSTSGQLDNLNVDGMMMLRHMEELMHIQECQEAQGGATAAQNGESIKEDSHKEIVKKKETI